jgi:very-short-patch-repair endonuclease
VKTRYAQSAASLAGAYRDGVFGLDLVALLDEWREASNAIILVRTTRKKRVWEALAPFTDAHMPDDVGGEIARLIDVKALWVAAGRHDPVLSALGPVWRGLATNVVEVEALFAWAETTRAAAERLARPDQPKSLWIDALVTLIRERRSELSGSGPIRVAVTQLLQAYKSFDAARMEVTRLADTADEWLGLPPEEGWLVAAATMVQGWERGANQLQRWCKWQEVTQTAQALGLAPIVSALASGMISADEIASTFELGYARCWIEQIVEREEALRTFVADQHNDTIACFAELDEKIAALARRVVAGQLSGNLPPRTAFGRDPEFGTLAREIEKRARHMPLRQLFGQMPTALTKLAPCVMMSPLSIAQYLPAHAKPFDVVIFDEASQIPVWDAIGASARGNQVIVVGDPKQLPPTAFFDRSDDGYDDASDLEDLESILDECLAANVPHKRLAWHYRSRHESLIAFSNERYYDGRLVTFPSPVTDDRAVRYVHVPGGTYERGSGRVNREEARAVVKDVVRRLSAPVFGGQSCSLGIVTFNTEQQRLIENLLDQERRARPELDRFFARDSDEPVFVKNLESVQGDERDVILFSVGYGPDPSGRVSQNFGPLNKDGGARRLNVAITRARSELLVFATLKPDQIDLSRTKAAGVRDFKHFLEYAERGPRALAEAAAPLDRDTDSPFEDAVKNALENRGWVVHPQVGVAGFRVDLGIVHLDAPGRYLAGVECDGATYHRSATARDRDLLRERVLRDLGWRIHRVWSMDWWVDADRAIEVLDAALTSDLEDERRQAAERAARGAELAERATDDLEAAPGDEGPAPGSVSITLEKEIDPQPVPRYAERFEIEMTTERRATGDMAVGKRYEVSNFEAAGFTADREAFYDMGYRPTLRRMVAHVISVEGPIFDDLLVHRIARAHGFGRAAGKIREIILDVIERRFPRSTEEGRKIFWPEGADKSQLPAFRPGSLDHRDHADIPLVELASLARRFLDEGFEPQEAAVLIGRELCLGRLREAARVRFEEAARLAQRLAL